MLSPNANPTPVTPPRVPLIDPRTNLIDRAWYMFFLSLFNAAQNANDLLLDPNTLSLLSSYDAASQALAQNVNTQPAPVDLSAELSKQIEAANFKDYCSGLLSQVAEMQKQLEAFNLLPLPSQNNLTNGTSILYGDGFGGFSNVTIGSGLSFTSGTLASSVTAATAPLTKTADFTVGVGETWFINNKSGSTCTVTLPSAGTYTGRELTFKNMQAQTLVSASSNVVPIDSTSAGTAILLAVVGNWATMVSDGTNWIIMQQAANNCLLSE
jgi:hypothetical protein